MKLETMLALRRCLKRDDSKENQQKQANMLKGILKINQEVFVSGIAVIEIYEDSAEIAPMLSYGLKLVRRGMEPQMIESILLNAAIANETDLLESLLVMDGVQSIQMRQGPDITRELLLSYFDFQTQERIRKGIKDLRLNSGEPLGMAEVGELLRRQKNGSGSNAN